MRPASRALFHSAFSLLLGRFLFLSLLLIVPVLIHLKDPSWFPHQKQYPLKSEVKEGLIPIIKDLKRLELLIECSSPYNTPILSVRKGPNKWWLVQDLHLINEAVVPLHPVVPNPYTLLAQILPGTAYYSVLDLKDAFFCIPLHPKSQPIFAFEDPTRKSGQVTWTVLPQGFRDNPHLFGSWVSSNPRLGRMAISTSYSATICR
jgi:hypothetical protein